ncbi:MAG: 1-acyl-sn-glycerol-3-phosphate acyltransferase, partial [Marinobacter sp.]
LIVRGGRNLYPGEIEEAVGRLEQVRSGCVVAFATGMGGREGEKLVVVAETRETDADVRERLQQEITRIARESLSIDVDEVVLARPHVVPKTTSGKLRRNEARLRYERGQLEHRQVPVWRQLARLAGSGWQQQGRRILKGMRQWLYAGWAWTALALVCVPVVALVHLLPRPGWRWRLCHWGARFLGLLTGTRLQVRGRERLHNLPDGCVIVANHSSYIDAFVLAALVPVPATFLAKAELRRFALLRHFLDRIGVETVDRTSGQSSVSGAREIAERARHRRLIVFAEGGFDAAPGLRPFHMGAFMTASLLQEPVIPVALRGTRDKLPAERWNPRPGPVEAIVGEPVEPAGDDWASATRLRDTTRRRILEMTSEPDRLERAR